MKNLNSVPIISALTFLLSALAYAGDRTPVDPAKLNSVMSELRPLLLPRVRAFSRPVVLYSWTNRSTIGVPVSGAIAISDPAYFRYAKTASSSFFRYSSGNQDVMGPGLYLAIDPVVTRSYGARGPTWAVIAMTARLGARFLDLATDPDATLPPSLVQALGDEGCLTDSVSGIFASANGSLDAAARPGRSLSGKACQAIRAAIGRDSALNVAGVRYSYSGTPYINCSSDRSYAFAVWNAEAMFDSQASYGFTERSATDVSDVVERAKLSALFRSTISRAPQTSGNLAHAGFPLPYPELIDSTPSAELDAFMKKSLMGCDGEYSEDRTSVSNP